MAEDTCNKTHWTKSLSGETLWNKVSSRLDDYCKFSWDDTDMTTYHVFIESDSKGSLKFYNGPSYSNNYTKPQFSSASNNLTGISFNTWSISFTIAVVAVTENMYRQLIHKLSPYTVGNLQFNFQKEWRYVVKLSKVEDGTRTYIGKDSDGNELFLTEMQLTFEVQGDAVAHSISELGYTISSNTVTFNNQAATDLDTPFLATFKVTPDANAISSAVKLNIKYGSHFSQAFNLVLQNLTSGISYTLEYNSKTGDLCLIKGDERKILSLLTTYTSGKRIVSALESKSIMLPGGFDHEGVKLSNVQLVFEPTNCTLILQDDSGCGINCYGRTNLI